MAVVFQTSGIFAETFVKSVQKDARVAERFREFRKLKSADPTQAFGNSDTSFAGIFTEYVPKLRHAHLTRDLSVFYTVGHRDPTVIKLYGIFSHADSGTGTPRNVKKQKSLAAQLKNQTFTG
jgi:hypothetical protein